MEGDSSVEYGEGGVGFTMVELLMKRIRIMNMK